MLYLMQYLGLSPLPFFAYYIGTTEPAVRLLTSILLTYPLAMIYNKFRTDQRVQNDVNYKHLFFIITGLDIGLFNFGYTMYHNLLASTVTYLIINVATPGPISVATSFVFNLTYLVYGYFSTETEDYDITWTMSHCVLTLKLIALSFDLWDGQKARASVALSTNQKKTALQNVPGFLEFYGFMLFPACYLVGPIFSFERYKKFVLDKFPLDRDASVYKFESLKRLALGLAYLTAFQLGSQWFSSEYLLSEDFVESSLMYRHYYVGIWGHFVLYKYISCWLLTEAACMRFGISYNGTTVISDTKFISRWDGCTNIKLTVFEMATKFSHYIDSFNCNTNHFAAEYIYKRLKFLGNPRISQFLTLFFLAVWHGTQSGYYATFFNEFIIINMEKQIEKALESGKDYNTKWTFSASMPFTSVVNCLIAVILKLYTVVFMGWSLVPFDLKTASKWWPVYYSLGFSGYVLFLPWVFGPFIKKALIKKFGSPAKEKES